MRTGGSGRKVEVVVYRARRGECKGSGGGGGGRARRGGMPEVESGG